jgi:hypothetical protein
VSEDSDHLSVVCRSCGSEVSPYITECPYCGNRLRKRSPKLGSKQDPAIQAERRKRRSERRSILASITDSGRALERKPAVTVALVVVAVVISAMVRAGLIAPVRLLSIGDLGAARWKILTAPYVQLNTAYAFVVLGAYVMFGSWFERVMGHVAALIVWIAAGAGGVWLASLGSLDVAAGALGPAVAVTTARGFCAVEARRDDEDQDVVGIAVTLAVLVLLPPLTVAASWYSVAAGVVVGMLAGAFAVVKQRADRAG